MDDLNEMGNLHTAGATGRHTSPFDDLPTYKNETDLTSDFIKKWVVPYYMEIGSYDNPKWVDLIKEIKDEITPEICLSLLGDFNWRTRLVGTCFTAVKGYKEFIDIIGTHLLKSEVCYVGHYYAITLSFFNEENCIQYLNRYLDYYLTRPSLYFDQSSVMEALLYLDKENKTDFFSKHIDKWNTFQEERTKLARYQAQEIAKTLNQLEEEAISKKRLDEIDANIEEKSVSFSTEIFDEQVAILKDLNQYSS